MSDLNKVILIGNLGAAPEVKFGQSGKARARLSVATNRTWVDAEKKKHEETQWHQVIVWDKSAEACGEWLSAGDKVSVEGRIETRTYDDNGTTKYLTEIIAEHVGFLKTKKSASGRPAAAAEPPAAAF